MVLAVAAVAVAMCCFCIDDDDVIALAPEDSAVGSGGRGADHRGALQDPLFGRSQLPARVPEQAIGLGEPFAMLRPAPRASTTT